MTSEPPETWDDLPSPLYLPAPNMLEEYETVNVLAPLVRCSKLPFRHLVSLYETHITHTPMILAQEFCRSQAARVADFSTSRDERGVFWMEPRWKGKGRAAGYGVGRTHPDDSGIGESPSPPDCPVDGVAQEVADLHLHDSQKSDVDGVETNGAGPSRRRFITHHSPPPTTRLPPLPIPPSPKSQLVRGCVIAQFAAPHPKELPEAAELIAPYVDGLDINCGCPQGWAYSEGIGCALLRKPEVVRELVRAVHGRMGWEWPVSIKIRVDKELSNTEHLVSTAIQAGVSHITIHGRTRHQASSHPVSLESIKFAVECAKGAVPCVANGDLWTLDDAEQMRKETGVQGVMAARGLLANPALFAGYKDTPDHAVTQFVNLGVDYGLIFPLFHRHLSYMLESTFARPERVYFNFLGSVAGAIDHLTARGMDPHLARKVPMWDARRGRSLLHAAS